MIVKPCKKQQYSKVTYNEAKCTHSAGFASAYNDESMTIFTDLLTCPHGDIVTSYHASYTVVWRDIILLINIITHQIVLCVLIRHPLACGCSAIIDDIAVAVMSFRVIPSAITRFPFLYLYND